MKGPRVLLLGAGRMGGALLESWLARHALSGPPVVIEPTPTAALRAHANAGEVRLNPSAGANAPEIAVIAVKPQVFQAALAKLLPFLAPSTAILSVAAGKTVADIHALLGDDRRIVRAMPNTPAAVGRGMTVACAPAGLDDGLKGQCTALLEAVGDVAWIDDEALMDPVTAVSGSGPAYVFYLVECLAEAGVAAGLSADLAMRLARTTVAGSGALLDQRAEQPNLLRAEVTSPGGTTEAALKVLMGKTGLRPLLADAVAAATARARELAG